MRFHITRLGKFASRNLKPDIDGYIYTTIKEVKKGNWDAMITVDTDFAREVAARNREAIRESQRDINAFRCNY